MLEILAVLYLASANAKIAAGKHRNPAGYAVLTVVLWVVFEFTGAFLAGLMGLEGLMPYVIAIAAAAVGGGVIARAVVNYADEGTYQTPAEKRIAKAVADSRTLSEPAEIIVTNGAGNKGKYVYFYHNGVVVSGAAVDESVTIKTDKSVNAISVTYERGEAINNSFLVETGDGETKYVSFANNKFTMR
jgi:hypothetical protein